MLKKIAAVAVLATGLTGGANAALLSGPVDADEYITFGGLNWAWASPCMPNATDCNEFVSIVLFDGWRLPTVAEYNDRPAPEAFYVGDPLDNPLACAAAWFVNSVDLNYCDTGDAEAGYIYHPTITTYIVNGDELDGSGAETWLVQEIGSGGPTAVPEPATLAVLGMGFLGLGLARRRKMAKA